VISLITCTRNEEKNIGPILQESRKYVDEIIVIDSKFSKDKTREIAKKYGAKVFVDNGKGKGEALRLGIEKARGDILIFMDADGSSNTFDIPILINVIKNENADMVIASRTLGKSDEREGIIRDFLKKILGRTISLLLYLRFRKRITDTQNGFRAVKKSILKELNLEANYFDIETEMTIKCLKKNFKIVEIPTHEFKRKFGRSHMSFFKHGIFYIWTFFKNIF
jgi:glycosyltransferase involved in cell wall biosynthesis